MRASPQNPSSFAEDSNRLLKQVKEPEKWLRVSPYFVTRDPSLKPAGAVTNTMDKDGLWCGGLWSSGKGRAMCNYDDYCGG